VRRVRSFDPRPRRASTAGNTRLARARLEAGYTQSEMSAWTGIPIATYRRLERGELRNPPIRHISNCAIVLKVALEDLIEDEWRDWLPLDPYRTMRQPRALPRRHGV
jgi:transcriptional regulator with XRE-family HTH domain